ncbi:hypothetical protein [Mycolicibacterium llatzerense]|uniref:hypothetical protein n=1 Tax=Mycolicibacterium llatzerense TaxID=280871 RepID=UPI0021B58B19|nr:hypothetical protein [Mycolicibacterium llatzerense]MCT7367308.1 hypothetical protein [Mycolicibacterium llatzerense]
MTTSEALSDEDWGRGLQQYGRGAQDGDDIAEDEAFGDIDVAALMADDDDEPPTGPVDLDAGQDSQQPKERFDHKLLWGFGGLVAAGVVAALAGSVIMYSHDGKPAPSSGGSLSEPQAVAVAKPSPTTTASATSAGVDRSLPYTADAKGSCAEGSTPAQTMSGADPHNAFVCVRGGGDGQTIDIDLGRTYMVCAVSLTPGWVGLDASGVAQWSQHRVVRLVQYSFPDNPAITPVTQDTKDVHGEAVQPLKCLLVSKIRMLIRWTERPPADPAAAPTTAPRSGGGLAGVFSESAPNGAPIPPPNVAPLGGQGSDGSDPVDATFAISTLKILGHEAI